MSATHVQVVKWSFPAVALIIGLFWYKCRRADRADPGGTPDSDCSDRTLVDCRKETVSSKSNSNFYDSDIHIEESYTLNSSCKSTEETACSPRKRSESLDIPQRKPGTQTAFIRSKTSSQETKTDIQLGSNPKTNNFETIARSRSSSSLENAMDVKVMKIFENVAEEEEQKVASEEDNSLEYVSKDEEHETNNECSYHQSEEQSDTTPSKECSKSPAQALSERDSAMHSPVSGVLEGSVTDEARSEGSADSGKGGSIKDHLKESMMPQTYQFNVPQNLVGRLIGVHRSFLQSIQMEANVNIYVDYHPSSMNLKLCRITGSSEGIKVALEMIRQKFPENKYPELTLEQILPFNDWLTEFMQLSLVGGVNNDVVICHIVKPNRFFVQLPTHPTYPYLWTLVDSMTKLYNTTDSPSVPEELTKGMLLVANWQNRWVRACIENPDPNGERHLVRLVDHGGYWYFSSVEMKKIRSDYLTLPFQAIEVFLANVQPTNGKWSQDAYDVVFHLCCGTIGQAQIGGYINSSTYVNLYLNIPKYGVISLADELIVRKLAYATPLECIVPEEGITVSYTTV
ncbi:A-kinase anchor protein spoonbill [Halictus rubicundus]|uniref:A-kinase anchor protein spoonbill n=1 Tax=Halictus rubicundus TaxID=77578 RepID=UPI00403557FE